jgi:hypothetical protein
MTHPKVIENSGEYTITIRRLRPGEVGDGIELADGVEQLVLAPGESMRYYPDGWRKVPPMEPR